MAEAVVAETILHIDPSRNSMWAALAHPCARGINASMQVKCLFRFRAELKRWARVIAPVGASRLVNLAC